MSAGDEPSVWVLYPPSGPFDAIAEHARGVAGELNRRGIPARFQPGGARALARRALSRQGDWLFVEYMPYSYGRWGAAPALVAALGLARLVPRAPRLVLMVHEAPVTVTGARSRVMSTWQRWQLRVVARVAERGFGSTEANCALLRAMAPRCPVAHLPIPSNVPRGAADRAAARSELGIAGDELVFATFGGRHPTRALGHVEAALAAVAGQIGPCTLMNLGAEAPPLTLPAGVRVIAPGAATHELLSLHLAASDVYLAAFHDGASTRRTTLAAAFAHGLAVAGTDGPQTDELLRRPPRCCLLAPVERTDLFVAACLRLAADPSERGALGAAALNLYASALGWEATGNQLAAAFAAPAGEVGAS